MKTLIIVTSLAFAPYSSAQNQKVPTQIIKGLSPDYCEQLGKAITEMSPNSTYRCV